MSCAAWPSRRHVLGVDTVVVMQHTNCGLAGVTDAELQERTGADLGFFSIDDHAAALREDIELLSTTPYLAPLQVIAGFVYDVQSGEIDDVAPLAAQRLRRPAVATARTDRGPSGRAPSRPAGW